MYVRTPCGKRENIQQNRVRWSLHPTLVVRTDRSDDGHEVCSETSPSYQQAKRSHRSLTKKPCERSTLVYRIIAFPMSCFYVGTVLRDLPPRVTRIASSVDDRCTARNAPCRPGYPRPMYLRICHRSAHISFPAALQGRTKATEADDKARGFDITS